MFTHDYEVFLQTLRQTRIGAGITQVELAARIGETQSWVSMVERGQRRLDLMEVRVICQALGLTLLEFVEQVEAALKNS